MLLKKWEELPPVMQNDSVRGYYDILKNKQVCLFFKRIFDIIVSLFLLILLIPVFLVLAIAVKADSAGPVFYRQKRVTQYGKNFYIHKFRTMVHQSECLGAQITVENDKRVTRVGKVLRKFRLDELPQLADVLVGNMTFCATRAEIPKYVAEYTPEMMATLLLPAGVTCLASILYKDEAKLLIDAENVDYVYTTKILPAKMWYNLQALKNIGFWSDIKVMMMTVLAVCGKEYTLKESHTDDSLET